MIRVEVLIHLLATEPDNLPAKFTLFFREQIVDECVRPGKVISIRHASFVIITEIGSTFWVPLCTIEQDLLRQLAIFIFATKKPGETERSGDFQRIDDRRAIAPPMQNPF